MASATVSSFAARLRQLQLDVCRLPSVQRRQMRALLRDALQLVESGTEHAGRVSLSVVASKRLPLLTDNVQELYANYGYEYWLNFVPTNLSTLPRDATFVRAVLWTILSNGSTMDRSLKERFGSRIADNADVRQQYRDMACPFRLDSSRRRP